MSNDLRPCSLHFVLDLAILKSHGSWDIFNLERVIGMPREYPSHTTRLYLVVPELSIGEVDLEHLDYMLDTYSGVLYDQLYVTVVYNDDMMAPRNHVFNHRGDHELVITIISSETLHGYMTRGLSPFEELFSGAGLTYDGARVAGTSLKLDQILDPDGSFTLKPDVDPRTHPYTSVQVHAQTGQLEYPIRRKDVI